jgi:hypothetical protein
MRPWNSTRYTPSAITGQAPNDGPNDGNGGGSRLTGISYRSFSKPSGSERPLSDWQSEGLRQSTLPPDSYRSVSTDGRSMATGAARFTQHSAQATIQHPIVYLGSAAPVQSRTPRPVSNVAVSSIRQNPVPAKNFSPTSYSPSYGGIDPCMLHYLFLRRSAHRLAYALVFSLRLRFADTGRRQSFSKAFKHSATVVPFLQLYPTCRSI